MAKGVLFRGFSITSKQFFLIFFLIFNSVTWFLIASFTVRETSLFWMLHVAVLASLLIGPLFAEKISRQRFLLFWIGIGIVSSLFPVILPEFGTREAVILISWGFAFGIGFPSCLAFMSALTRVEERGRVGGTIFFVIYLTSPPLALMIGSLETSSSSIFLCAWRSLSLPMLLTRGNLENLDTRTPLKTASYSSVISNRQFLLYFSPWLVFCLINQLEHPIFQEFLGVGLWETLMIVEGLVGSLLGFISGWFLDFKGRKWTILIGLIALGLGYAALGFFPYVAPIHAFFIFVDGIAWGIFSVTFGFVVWGDIASHLRAEKFYGIGAVPYPLAITLSTLASPWLRTVHVTKAFPLASFFLFLAVIPIFFALELLPEKVMKERELRRYVEEVKKVTGRG